MEELVFSGEIQRLFQSSLVWHKQWIKIQEVYDAMMQVDRADFAPMNPYENNPQVIPCNVVISAPLLHAYCLEQLKDKLKPGCKALDIRFGSGYLTVAMSKMMNDKRCEGKNSHLYLGRSAKYFPLKREKHLHNQIGLLLNW